MTFDNFVNKYIGKATQYSLTDGVKTVQCVDLIKLYLDNVYNIHPSIWAWGNAKDYFICFNDKEWQGYKLLHNKGFIKLNNTKEFVPMRGDIVVWKSGAYGHIAIATGQGDTKSFYSYDQNYGGKEMKIVKHTYADFLGALRPPKTITADVNVREGSGINYKIVGEKKKGESVIIYSLSADKKWGKIGDKQWINMNYCS